jgi:outer membrane protein assembly factor BamB
MDRSRARTIASAVVLGALAASALARARSTAPRPGVDWPGFRGIQAAGIADGAPTAVEWNVPAGRNVRWRVPVPGLAHSSPVIWGGRLCITTAASGKDDALRVGLYGDITPVDDATPHAWRVLCYDKHTGAPLWDRTATQGVPRVKRHTKATQANATAAMDERHVAALFGAEGLFVYDAKGKLLWKKDLGVLDAGFFRVPGAQWGHASSPVIHEGRLFVLADVQKDSFLAAFDLTSGRELWRTPRADVPTWGTPTVHVEGGRAQVVVNGWKHIGGYDAATGRELWKMTGGGDIPVPTPVAAHGLLFITNAHGGSAPIYAVRAGAAGDVTLASDQTANAHVAWSQPRDGAYMQTPLVYGGRLYVCRDNGVLTVFEAATGKQLYQTRLSEGGGYTASAVAADGRVYFTSEEGDVHVVRAGPSFELLARNPLGEVTLATPAISEGVLYFRTRCHLVAVAEPGTRK